MRAACLAVGWAMAAAIVWLSLTPSPPSLDVRMGDKLGHFLGYGSAVKTRLTVAENLTFWRTMYGPTGIGVPEALERVGLAHTAALDAGVLSAGQTRRLGLARLLVSKRAVWLLDEPTASLDTAGNLLVQDMIDEHAKAGGAAIVATHDPLAITHRVLKLGGAP